MISDETKLIMNRIGIVSVVSRGGLGDGQLDHDVKVYHMEDNASNHIHQDNSFFYK